jgi:hypothetical protein
MNTVRPFRCFDSRAILVSLGVAAWLMISAWLGHGFAPASAPRVLLALGQAAAFASLVLVLARSVARLDELEQRIHHEALAAAAAIVVTAIAAWAFLEWAGLPPIDWSVVALPAFTIAWAVGVIWISRRYR